MGLRDRARDWRDALRVFGGRPHIRLNGKEEALNARKIQPAKAGIQRTQIRTERHEIETAPRRETYLKKTMQKRIHPV